MNENYLEEYTNLFERVLSVAYEQKYSPAALEKQIVYSSYFRAIEEDKDAFAPIITEADLIKAIFTDIPIDIESTPHYRQCIWAAESYLRIQGDTGLTFEAIFLYLPIQKMYQYFDLYHEMDFSQIINRFKELYAEKSILALLLTRYRYPLTYVAEQTKIPYATLSSLKKRKRDIQKASVDMVASLARFLHVRIETLAELKI